MLQRHREAHLDIGTLHVEVGNVLFEELQNLLVLDGVFQLGVLANNCHGGPLSSEADTEWPSSDSILVSGYMQFNQQNVA